MIFHLRRTGSIRSTIPAAAPDRSCDSVSAMVVVAVPVRASMVIGPAVIDITRAVVMSVVEARRIVDPRARIVDRRSLIVRRRRAVIDGCRRVYGRRRSVVPVVVIGLRARGDPCSRNRADRAAYCRTITAVNVV